MNQLPTLNVIYTDLPRWQWLVSPVTGKPKQDIPLLGRRPQKSEALASVLFAERIFTLGINVQHLGSAA